MKKKIALIAYEASAKEKYMKQLNQFFAGAVEINGYCISKEKSMNFQNEDIFLLTFADLLEYIQNDIPETSEIVYMTRTFENAKLHCLESYKGRSLLLYDYSQTLAFETMGILKEAGFKDIDFTIISKPEALPKDSIPPVMVTIEDTIPKPDGVEEMICIGWYCISLTTFADLVARLSLLGDRFSARLWEYSKIVNTPGIGIVNTLKYAWKTRDQFEKVIDMLDDGAILLEGDDILHYNSKARKYFMIDAAETPVHAGQLHKNIVEILRMENNVRNLVVDLRDLNNTVILSREAIITDSAFHETLLIIKDATEIQEIEENVRVKKAEKGFFARYTFQDVITQNAKMQKCIEISRKIAATDLSILLTGSSGVGKELMAQSIHNASRRSSMPFVAVNCAALPGDLLESELFGYEEGAFTGAKKGGKKGLFELAHKGTVFLDEIGDISLMTQIKLLRVLQEKEIIHVGGDRVIPIDVRVIAASNADFAALIAEKKFRKDLFYRINMAPIHIPDLKERPDDIPLLAQHFLTKITKGKKSFGSGVLNRLSTMEWNGNIRELQNCIEYMSAIGGNVIAVNDLPLSCKPVTVSPEISFQNETEIDQLLSEILAVRPMGRRRLMKYLAEQGIHISEYQIRKALARIQHTT